jgi:hypothetical protein
VIQYSSHFSSLQPNNKIVVVTSFYVGIILLVASKRKRKTPVPRTRDPSGIAKKYFCQRKAIRTKF